MKRICITLAVLSLLTVLAMPAAAQNLPTVNTPDECQPGLYIDAHTDSYGTTLLYNPSLSVNCPLFSGSWLSHESELIYIMYWVEHQHRPSINHPWDSDILLSYLLQYHEIYALGGSPYYNLGGGHAINGATIGHYHRYRLAVHVVGYTADSPNIPNNIEGKFDQIFYSSWLYGPDSVEVAPIFENRPDEWVPERRDDGAVPGSREGADSLQTQSK
jgi:hypothetical protein